MTANDKPFTVVVDPGHTPRQAGALGARGVDKVVYHDALASKLVMALQSAGVKAVLTRKSSQNICLADRAELANTLLPNLFLSVHHDSAQPKYLARTEVDGKPAYQTVKPITGYSIFASTLNPKFDASYEFAQLLGKAMVKLGRPPALHHA